MFERSRAALATIKSHRRKLGELMRRPLAVCMHAEPCRAQALAGFSDREGIRRSLGQRALRHQDEPLPHFILMPESKPLNRRLGGSLCIHNAKTVAYETSYRCGYVGGVSAVAVARTDSRP